MNCIRNRQTSMWLVALCALLLTTCSDSLPGTDEQIATTTAKSTSKLADGRTEDTFVYDEFSTRARVDVLFVDDNSDSMRDAQKKLGDRLKDFLGSVAKIDWQIGITTTDVSDGPFGLKGRLIDFPSIKKRFLVPTTPNVTQLFADTIVRKETWDCGKVCPSTDERPLRATIQAIGRRSTDNAGFFRPDADLVVIILSNEDEASDGGKTADTYETVKAAAKAAFGEQKSLTGFGLIVPPGDTACFAQSSVLGGQYGVLLNDFAVKSGGLVGSICAADYGPTLASIGQRVREGIKIAVLSATPIASTLEVLVTPPDATLTWKLSGRTLTFAHPPKPGSQVVVKYKAKE